MKKDSKKSKKIAVIIAIIVIIAVAIFAIAIALQSMDLSMLRPEDVYQYTLRCLPYLIPFIVMIIVVIALHIVTRKFEIPFKKLWRGESWIALGLALLFGVQGIILNPLYSSINLVLNSTSKGMTDETKQEGKDFTLKEAEEGVVLLKNEDNALPMSAGNINVFGWASTNPCYGGTGSGSVDTSTAVSLIDGLQDSGYAVNTELEDFYISYNTERGGNSLNGDTDWTLSEPAVDSYSDQMIQDAKDFSDVAIVVLARVGGEGEDLPKDMGDANYNTTADGAGHEGDFTEGMSYLELSKTEQDMVDMVCSNFDKVIVVYNSGNAFELGWVDQYPSIKAVLTLAGPGQTGFDALGEVLSGTVNPSGHLTDTYVYDLRNTDNYNNIGEFAYNNVQEFYDQDDLGSFNGDDGYDQVSFVNYSEGIYIGYKFYETAATEGLIDYDTTVQYPFGYGLSYTTFSEEMSDLTTDENGDISFDVNVTNTGDTAGKDVVEVYYTPPYYNGGIEKSSVNLLDFAKTDVLDAGTSQTLHFELNEEDMASFDENGYGCYVLENGDYNISIRSDSHTVIDSKDYVKDSSVIYDESNPRSTDDTAAVSVLDYAKGDVTYLSRADHFANYEEATAAPTNYSMSDEVKSQYINNDNYDIETYNNSSDQMPTQDTDKGIVLADLTGKDYDDPMWEDLLDELSVDDMADMIGQAGFSTKAIESIQKSETSEVDGPSGLHSFFSAEKQGSAYVAPEMLAASWNKELAYEYGEHIATEAKEVGVNGWYGPAMNIHRSAFSGRNYEYYSEDATLTGWIAASTVEAAQDNGIYCVMKHYALNDQEDNRNNQLCVWVDEQAAREGYLKAFEYAVKKGHATAMMSSFNYVGPTWAGASTALTETILRDEWGFRGFVITDAALDGYNYINGDQAMRNGTDAILNPDASEDTVVHDRTSATSVIALRNATHNILYTIANSYMYADENNEYQTPVWVNVFYGIIVVWCAILIIAEILVVLRYRKRKQNNKNVEE